MYKRQGIHGEPGIERCAAEPSAKTAKRMCDMLVSELALKSADECALLINGLGGTPLMELYILNKDIYKELESRGITVHETFVGNYMTSLDMAGASASLLKLDDELKKLLDSPANTLALKL